MTVTATACFEPKSKIREIREDLFVGKMVTLKLCPSNKNKSNQYVVAQHSIFDEYGLYISGWVGKYLGEKDTTIRKKITGFKLVEHRNGGRTPGEYDSYGSFFDENRKKRVQAFWSGGMMARILTTGGDPDQADVIVRCGDLEIDSSAWAIHAPEEWYSDLHSGDPKFRFVDGFYESADNAINAFNQKSHDDIFGTRFFPVIVFPAEKASIAKNTAQWAKGWSKPIVVNDNVAIGTRCKPDEFSKVIEDTYKNGGKVPIGVEWDWE